MTAAACRARRGMTLMELLVAMTITGMMTAAGYAAFASVIDHRRSLTAATARVERAAALRATLDEWLATGEVLVRTGAVPGGGGRSAGGDTARGAAAPSAAAAADADAEVTLVTTGRTPAMTPRTRLRLYIDADAETPERGLAIEYQASPQTPLLRRELDPAVTGMRVELLDQRTRRWVRASEAATVAPIAVRVTLSGAAGPGADPLPPLLRLPIVRATVDEPGPAVARGAVR